MAAPQHENSDSRPLSSMFKARKGGGTSRLLRGKRCQTPAEFKAMIREVVGMHLLGLAPYIRRGSVKEELEAKDPDPTAVWGRQRLTYQLLSRKAEMLTEQREKRPAEGSPSAGNLTEGLNTELLGFEEPAPALAAPAVEVNPLGGRPIGTIPECRRYYHGSHHRHPPLPSQKLTRPRTWMAGYL